MEHVGMAMKLYGPPLAYGGWALSLGLLLQAFFWLKFEESEEVDGNCSSAATGWGGDNDGEEFEEGREDDSQWAENREEGHETWGGASSSAYQTDEEARRERMAARRHSERLRREGFVPASGLVSPNSAGVDGPPFDTSSPRAPKAAAAAAITAAAAALRRPHFARLEPVDKSRVRRELLRARLHTHVQRELARHATLAAAVFDSSSPR